MLWLQDERNGVIGVSAEPDQGQDEDSLS